MATSVCNTGNRFHHLYENEADSDIILLVGDRDETERVPAHTTVLLQNDYFKALIQGPLADTKNNVYRFPDDSVKGFNYFIRWMYQRRLDLRSIQSSLDTMDVSIKYLCAELTEQCIIYISDNLKPDNVLQVLEWIHLYCNPSTNDSVYPSAPAYEEYGEDNSTNYSDDKSQITNDNSQQTNASLQDPTIYCQQLLNQCLELIDHKTEAVLASEYLDQVSINVLQLILHRPHLTLESELSVINALQRWSKATCKKKQLPILLENRRKVLDQILYLPRYLTLSDSDLQALMNAPENNRLLTVPELNYMSMYIMKGINSSPPSTMLPYINNMSTRREPPSPTDRSMSTTIVLKNKKNKHNGKKKFSKKELLWDLFSALAHLID